MATQEELKVVISTAYDNAGVRAAQQDVRTLTAQQIAANDALRKTMAAAPQTTQAFRQQFREIEALIGRPTLGPGAFGISTAGAPGGPPVAPQAAQTVRQVGESARFTGSEFARMGLAFIGAGVGLSAFTAIGN